MKNFLIGLLLVTTVAFAGLYVSQSGKTRKAEADLAGLKNTVSDLEAKVSQQERRTTGLQERLQDTRIEAHAHASQAAELQQELTSQAEAGPATNEMKAAFGEMFKNPEMREMIKKQQKTVMDMMVNKNFAAFFASMNLTPEQTASLKELITKKALVDAGMGIDMMAGDLDANKRKELSDEAKADKGAIDEEIKSMLGADGYSQYETYEKTIHERMAVEQFKDSLAGGSATLSADQEQQLMKVMSDERAAFKFTTDYNDQSKFDGDFETAFSEEKMNTFFTEQEQLSQKYLERARSILSPEQVVSYEKFLSNQRDMMKAAMKMASAMFAPKKTK